VRTEWACISESEQERQKGNGNGAWERQQGNDGAKPWVPCGQARLAESLPVHA
jgi:hypothetical protein